MARPEPEPELTAEQEVKAYEAQVYEALKSFHKRTHYEPTTEQTPVDVLLASEDGTLDEWAVIRETALKIMLWIASGGPHPAELLKRLYLLGDHMMISPYCELNLREKAALCNVSHGTMHWLMKRICIDPLLRKGAVSVNAPGGKGSRAAAVASAVQQGNSNRRGSTEPGANGSAAVGRKRKQQRKPTRRKRP